MTLLLNLRPDGITRGDRLALNISAGWLPDAAEHLITEAMRSDAHRLNIAAVIEECSLTELAEFMDELWQWVPADSTMYDRFTDALDEYYGKAWHIVRESA